LSNKEAPNRLDFGKLRHSIGPSNGMQAVLLDSLQQLG
jgi:hypothetical protein